MIQTFVRTGPDAGAAVLAAECCVEVAEVAEVMCDAGAPVVMCAVEAPPPSFGGEASRLTDGEVPPSGDAPQSFGVGALRPDGEPPPVCDAVPSLSDEAMPPVGGEPLLSVDEVLAGLAGAQRLVAMASQVPFGSADGEALAQVIAAGGRLSSAVEALLLAATAAMEARRAGSGSAALRDEAHMSARSAARKAALSEQVAQMPNVARGLACGALTAEHAEVLADTARRSSSETVDAAPDLLETAAVASPDVLRRDARAFLARHDPASAASELARQRRQRSAALFVDDETGMGVLNARFDPVGFALVRQAVENYNDALWRRDGGRDGTPAAVRDNRQRLADSVFEMLTNRNALAIGQPPATAPTKPADCGPPTEPAPGVPAGCGPQPETAPAVPVAAPAVPALSDLVSEAASGGIETASDMPAAVPAVPAGCGPPTEPTPGGTETAPDMPGVPAGCGPQPGTAPDSSVAVPGVLADWGPRSGTALGSSAAAPTESPTAPASRERDVSAGGVGCCDGGGRSVGQWAPAQAPNQLVIVADIGVIDGTAPDGRCEVLGAGPVPASILDSLSPDTRITGALFAGPGRSLWLGRDRRHASAAQQLVIAIRDRGCVLCHKPMHRCQYHHVDEWFADNGTTDPDNLAALCNDCHDSLHKAGRRLCRDAATGHWATQPRPPGRSAQTSSTAPHTSTPAPATATGNGTGRGPP